MNEKLILSMQDIEKSTNMMKVVSANYQTIYTRGSSFRSHYINDFLEKGNNTFKIVFNDINVDGDLNFISEIDLELSQDFKDVKGSKKNIFKYSRKESKSKTIEFSTSVKLLEAPLRLSLLDKWGNWINEFFDSLVSEVGPGGPIRDDLGDF